MLGSRSIPSSRDLPSLIAEQHPLNMNDGNRSGYEISGSRCYGLHENGVTALKMAVLRMAEILALVPARNSTITYKFLSVSRWIYPMLNSLTQDNAASALQSNTQ